MKGSGDTLARDYVNGFEASNKKTAKTYRLKLRIFSDYLRGQKTTIDATIEKIKAKKLDPYVMMAGFAAYIGQLNVSAIYQTQTVKTVKNFLEYNDIPLSDHTFRLKVKLKRVIKKKKLGLSKDQVRDIIQACEDIRLKTFVMWLACTGMRETEALYVKTEDINFDANPPYVFIHGENTKTGRDRTVFLTTEIVNQIKKYLVWKYRERRTKYVNGKIQYGKFEPTQKKADYIFMPYHHEGAKISRIESVYADLLYDFTQVREHMGINQWEDENERRRKITFHSFRRFVKTEISDLGYQDFSEYFIGHAGSEYHAQSEQKKIELFRKIEPYLTFMDFAKLEAKARDTETQLDDDKRRIADLEKGMAEMQEMMRAQKGLARVREGL